MEKNIEDKVRELENRINQLLKEKQMLDAELESLKIYHSRLLKIDNIINVIETKENIILNCLKSPKTIKEVQEETGMNINTLTVKISRLFKEGKILKEKKVDGNPSRFYIK